MNVDGGFWGWSCGVPRYAPAYQSVWAIQESFFHAVKFKFDLFHPSTTRDQVGLVKHQLNSTKLFSSPFFWWGAPRAMLNRQQRNSIYMYMPNFLWPRRGRGTCTLAPQRTKKVPHLGGPFWAPKGCWMCEKDSSNIDQNTYSNKQVLSTPIFARFLFFFKAMSCQSETVANPGYGRINWRHCYASEIYHRPQNCKITRDLKRCQELFRGLSSSKTMSPTTNSNASCASFFGIPGSPSFFPLSIWHSNIVSLLQGSVF